jgi:hypothetical protein
MVVSSPDATSGKLRYFATPDLGLSKSRFIRCGGDTARARTNLAVLESRVGVTVQRVTRR